MIEEKSFEFAEALESDRFGSGVPAEVGYTNLKVDVDLHKR